LPLWGKWKLKAIGILNSLADQTPDGRVRLAEEAMQRGAEKLR